MGDDISFARFIARLEDVPSQERLRQPTETPSVDIVYEIHRPDGAFNDLLIFYHGGGAHGRAGYDRMAQRLLAAAPVAVCLPDVRGHGSSGGPRGHLSSPHLAWDDVDQLVALMRREFPGIRIHLGAHSSGAGMLLNHLTRRPPREPVDSLILLAPELGWRAGLYRSTNKFGSFAQVRVWPFLLAACTGGFIGGSLPAVYFGVSAEAERAGCVPDYTVNMANAVTPDDPAGQLHRLTLRTRIGIAEKDQLIDADRLATFITRHGGHNIKATRLSGTDHLGVILDSVPFLCEALAYPSVQEKPV